MIGICGNVKANTLHTCCTMIMDSILLLLLVGEGGGNKQVMRRFELDFLANSPPHRSPELDSPVRLSRGGIHRRSTRACGECTTPTSLLTTPPFLQLLSAAVVGETDKGRERKGEKDERESQEEKIENSISAKRVGSECNTLEIPLARLSIQAEAGSLISVLCEKTRGLPLYYCLE